MEEIKKNTIHVSIIAMLGIGVGINGTILLSSIPSVMDYKLIPKEKSVASGYISPSNMQIFCNDINNDGKKETYMKIDDKTYFLKWNQEAPIFVSKDSTKYTLK